MVERVPHPTASSVRARRTGTTANAERWQGEPVKTISPELQVRGCEKNIQVGTASMVQGLACCARVTPATVRYLSSGPIELFNVFVTSAHAQYTEPYGENLGTQR